MDDDTRPVGALQDEPEVMVKFVLEISKKMLPTASTFILAVVLAELGIVTDWEPSFGVLAANTVGNVCPPFVLKDIFTLAQLTGEAVVLATFHVTVCAEPPAQLTAVLGAVTVNGPEVLLTVTTMLVNCVWPILTGAIERYGALSLTVSLKFSVLETELSASVSTPASPPVIGPVVVPPARIVDNRGKYLVGDVVGANDIQLGPDAFVALALLALPVCDEEALSFCSQQ